MRLNKLIFYIAIAAVATAAAAPAGAAAAQELNGSGSTLAAPLVAEWALAFQTLDRAPRRPPWAGSAAKRCEMGSKPSRSDRPVRP